MPMRTFCLREQIAVGLKHLLLCRGFSEEDSRERIVGLDGSALAQEAGIASVRKAWKNRGDALDGRTPGSIRGPGACIPRVAEDWNVFGTRWASRLISASRSPQRFWNRQPGVCAFLPRLNCDPRGSR